MNREKDLRMNFKSARISGMDVSPADLAKINGYALSPLRSEDIFAFKVSMAGNEIDRDYEVFPRSTLVKLANLFVGKTVVKDHDHRSDNQIARIFATELVEGESALMTGAGESPAQLIAKCYMVKTSRNADLIAEIQAGIRKEVSLGCRVDKAVCSICGTDNVKTYCEHFPGKRYDGNQLCYFSLENASDAYELSFVAVPAQAHAGTVKSYGKKPYREEEITARKSAPNDELDAKEMLKQLHGIAQQLLVLQKTLAKEKEANRPALMPETGRSPEHKSSEDDEGRLTVNRAEEQEEAGACKDKTAQARLRALDLALMLRRKA